MKREKTVIIDKYFSKKRNLALLKINSHFAIFPFDKQKNPVC